MPIKDPQAKLDYSIDWDHAIDSAGVVGAAGTGWLRSGETITTSTWSVDGFDDDVAPLVIEASPAPTNTAGKTTVWVSGGTVTYRYHVTNHIVTSQGREQDRSIPIRIEEL